MNISLGGRVVIVDDKIEEALPLMRGFAVRSVPYIYFSGQEADLPARPLAGIRFLFLDVELWGSGAQVRIEDKCSAHRNLLSSLLDVSGNGPLIIVFWTTHIDEVEQIAACLRGLDGLIFLHTSLDKDEYQDSAKLGGYDIERLMKDVESKIAPKPLYVPFVLWENAVNDAATACSREFASLTPAGATWDKCLSYVFSRLDASCGGTDSECAPRDKTFRFKRACSLFNQCFLHVLQKMTRKIVIPDEVQFTGACKGLDDAVLAAKINTFLGFDIGMEFDDLCGTVRIIPLGEYRYHNLKALLYKDVFGSRPHAADEFYTHVDLCEAIITPQCDIANGHRLVAMESSKDPVVMHQVVYGLRIPVKEMGGRQVRSGTGRMAFKPYYSNGHRYQLVFCFYSISQEGVRRADWKPFLCLKREILNDLQAHAASQLNRIGNCLV